MIEFRQAQRAEEESRSLHAEYEKTERWEKLLQSLSSLDYRYQHRRLQRIRHAGTGVWLTEDLSFRSWLESSGSGGFCCFGIPGSGKTMLASNVVDTLGAFYTEATSFLCYHYCDYADASTLDPVVILGTLLRQLIERLNAAPMITSTLEKIFVTANTMPWPEDIIPVFLTTLDRKSTRLNSSHI